MQKKEKNWNIIKFFSGVLAGVVLGIVVLIFLFGGKKNSVSVKIEGKKNNASVEIEGDGYKTAENAVYAYLDAMKQGNVDGMLSAFAVETYVKNYDLEAYLERTHTWTISQEQPFPAEDAYMESLMVGKRYQSLSNVLRYQYLWFMEVKDWDGNLLMESNQPIGKFNAEEGRFETFADSLTDDNWMDDLSNLKYGKAFTVEELISKEEISLSAQMVEENIKELKKTYGCEKIEYLAVEVDFRGKEYYFTPTVGCYDGKWYLISHSGMIDLAMGANVYSGGFVER